MKIKYLFAVVLVVVLACESDDESSVAKETSLLTLTVDASYPTIDTDDWIIVHGEDGTVITFQAFESNQELDLVTNKPVQGKITITHVRNHVLNGAQNYSVKSYTEIERGKHLALKGAEPVPTVSGNVNISVSNVYSYQSSTFTNRHGTLPSGTAAWNINTGVLDIQSPTYAGVSKYIFRVTSGNMYKYKVLDNVQANDTYSLSFNDMIPFEKKATFIFPQATNVALFVYGSDHNLTAPNSFLLDMQLISAPTTAIVPEYIDALTDYRTELYITCADYGYSYVNQGSIPNGNSTWPQKSEFNVTEKSLTNFSAATSSPYVWLSSLWSFNDNVKKIKVDWSVSSPTSNFKIKELPSEIINAHPALALNNVSYNGTTFYTQSPTYESFFNNALQAGPVPTGVRVGISIPK